MYNTISETTSILIAVLLLFFMCYTKPRKTFTYGILFSGVIVSAIDSLIAVLLASGILSGIGNYGAFSAMLGGIYLLGYLMIVCHLYSYLAALTSKDQFFHRRTILTCVIYAVILYAVALFSYQVGYLDIRDPLSLARFSAGLGAIATVWSAVISIRHLKEMSKIVRVSISIFLPLELLLLLLQIAATEWIFLGLSYVLPATIYYILFHSNPYNEMTGTMNIDSLNTELDRLIHGKKDYVVLFVEFPQLRKQIYLNGEKSIRNVTIDVCQRVERISRSVHVYQVLDNAYCAVYTVKKDSERKEILDQILDAMEGVNHFGRYHSYYKAVAIKRFEGIDNLLRLYALWSFLHDMLRVDMTSECYLATTASFEKFLKQQRIREILEDIRDRDNIDDARVLCYAQPIYSVQTESFRTAESLMRLLVDDEIVPPADFLPEAERIGCVHDLTRIMLHKVCREVRELEKEHDFDGITINCSASEFMDKDLHADLLSIIDESRIDHKHVRFEITESSMGDHYDSVLYNMEKMHEAGIMFYLDDFGTGYSNLERILTCPFETIKFDKSMLYKGMQDKAMDSIVSTMVDVLKESDKVMLVEGVETDEQSNYSIDRGFDFIQGFKYAKPLPIENLEAYFTKRKEANK